MIRRYEYFKRNVVPALLYTLNEDVSTRLTNRIEYRCGSYRYRYHPEWARFPDALWGNVISGIACDSEGCLYVTLKCKDAPIAKFSPDGGLIRTFGEKLSFGKLHGISITDRGTVWVTDDTMHAAYHLDQDGNLLQTIGHPGEPSDSGYRADFIHPSDHSKPIRVRVFDEHGQESERIISNSAYRSIVRMAPPFNKPTKLLWHPAGLFASDGYGNTAVHAFDRDGNLLRSWGAPGSGAGEFSTVHSLWIDRLNRVWVCDRDNDRVQVFTMDGRLLTILDDLWYPVDVWSDEQSVYVLQNEGCISVFDMDYQLVAELGHWQCGNLTAHSLTGDRRGNLYLADCGVKGVVKLERL